jgi:hypothetical protein
MSRQRVGMVRIEPGVLGRARHFLVDRLGLTTINRGGSLEPYRDWHDSQNKVEDRVSA